MNASSFAVKNYAVGEKLAGRILLIALLALILFPISAFAQACSSPTSTWSGGASGSWNTATNWTPNGIPGSASNTCINTASSAVTVSGGATDNLQLALSTDSLAIANGTALTISAGGNIVNSGSITLNSSGSGTDISLLGATTLSGSGTLTMSNNTNNYFTGGSGVSLTNQSTIQGAGTIGNGSAMALVNSGTIDANVSSALTINMTGGYKNTGTLEATAGGELILDNTLTNTGGTILATGAGSEVVLNGLSITGGTLTSSSGGIIYGQSSATLNTLTISTGTTFDVQNSQQILFGAGTITNNGTINLQSSGSGTDISISGATTLAGTGSITMSNNTNNYFTGSGTLTNQETIQGSGNIGHDSAMGLTNSGTIDADVSSPLTIESTGAVTNTKTFEATAGGELIVDGTITNTGGTILATGTSGGMSPTASAVVLNGSTINGGTLTSSSGGIIYGQSSANISGVTISSGTTFDVQNAQQVLFTGTITNNGTMNLLSSGSGTDLDVQGNVTLAGTGKVIFSANANNYITGSGGTLTNDSTIEGEGNIGDGQIALVNEGTILANITAGGTLVIDANSTGFTNNVGTKNGVLTASAKNTIDIIGGGLTNYSSATNTLTGGTYNATGTIEFAAGSTGIVTNDATISLTSATGEILNSTTSTNALANFNTNGSKGSFSVTTQKFTDANEFTNDGILTVGSGGTLDFSTGLANFNSTTDTLAVGTYNVTGTLEFPGADIVVNNAIITLTGTTPKILNSTTSANALAGFDDNKGTFTVNGGTFTDANSFTNTGTLAAGAKGLFNASGGLTNFNNTNGTLTGGSYTLTTTGQIQFNNEGFANDIVTNDAKITLAGVDTTVSPFIDQSGNNALANFATNGASGSLLLTTDRVFTNTGSLTNAGIVNVEISSGTGKTELIIGGPGVYTQTGGTTTVDGVLSASGGINIQGGFLYGDALTTTGTEGTLIGPVDLTGGTLNPGNAVKLLGTIDITGTYAESGTGVLNIDLDGIVAGTKYDVLNVSGAAALGGTIDFVLNSAFKPVVGDTWDVLNYASETGSFSDVILPTAPTGDTYAFNCDATDCTLTLEKTPSAAVAGTVSGSPAKAVARGSLAGASTAGTHEPTAILSRVTCFATRMIGSACGDKPSAATVSHGGDLHEVASAHTELNSAHNNVMVATRSISSERGGASHETSASASAVARLYVCAYLPSSVGHTMGCN